MKRTSSFCFLVLLLSTLLAEGFMPLTPSGKLRQRVRSCGILLQFCVLWPCIYSALFVIPPGAQDPNLKKSARFFQVLPPWRCTFNWLVHVVIPHSPTCLSLYLFMHEVDTLKEKFITRSTQIGKNIKHEQQFGLFVKQHYQYTWPKSSVDLKPFWEFERHPFSTFDEVLSF